MTGRFHFPLVLIVTFAAVASSCGQVARTMPREAPEPRVMRVDAGDSGKTISLHPGDRLIVTLPTASPSPAAGTHVMARWVLASYPERILRFSGSRAGDIFPFIAKTSGRGRVVVIGDVCAIGGGPGVMATIRCPAAEGPASSDLASESGSYPPRPRSFVLTVVVAP